MCACVRMCVCVHACARACVCVVDVHAGHSQAQVRCFIVRLQLSGSTILLTCICLQLLLIQEAL